MPADERLTLREIERYDHHARSSGRVMRARCPLHHGDHQQSLKVNLDTGYYRCFQCDRRGFLVDEDGVFRRELRPQTPTALGPLRKSPPQPETESLRRLRLAAAMQRAQAAFPGSPAEAYCESRRIPATLARAYGAGYAATWKGRPHPRIVFPLHDEQGLVSFTARSLDPNCPKHLKHLVLRGHKGLFNFAVLKEYAEVIVVEGVFDALSAIAAGYPNTVALCGANDFRPEWFARQTALRLGLDADDKGRTQTKWIGRACTLLAKSISYLDPASLAGAKDLSKAWERDGRLQLD